MIQKNIFFFIGTTAELIKVFPIMRELDRQGRTYKVIASGQNRLDKEIILKTGVNPVDIQLSNIDISQSVLGLFSWFFSTTLKSLFKLRTVFRQCHKKNSLLVIHGDTISTVMGAFLGTVFRLNIVHIEAGLRSYDFFNPFPEEIDRMLVSSLSDMHCCPNYWAMNNVKNKSGVKVNTIQNTLLDSLNFALSLEDKSNLYKELSRDDFFIFVFHRQENLFDEALLKTVFTKILAYSKMNIKCLLIMHSPTEVALRKTKLLESIQSQPNVRITGRLSYFDFMNVLSISKFIVTDGGSNQEESYYFGKPCLILRKATERNEGLDENASLSGLDMDKVDHFLINYRLYNRDKVELEQSPSNIIINAMLEE